jgi:hypothetical protein
MKGRALNHLVLALIALVAASLTYVLGPRPAESDQSCQPASSEAKRQVLPETLALRIAAKSHIAEKVIDGRLSLAQAAALFGALNRLEPQSLKTRSDTYALRDRFPAHTEEERLCRQVVQWVSAELANEHDRQEATLARLEDEFKEFKQGMVQLPDAGTLVPVHKLLEQAREKLH